MWLDEVEGEDKPKEHPLKIVVRQQEAVDDASKRLSTEDRARGKREEGRSKDAPSDRRDGKK